MFFIQEEVKDIFDTLKNVFLRSCRDDLCKYRDTVHIDGVDTSDLFSGVVLPSGKHKEPQCRLGDKNTVCSLARSAKKIVIKYHDRENGKIDVRDVFYKKDNVWIKKSTFY